MCDRDRTATEEELLAQAIALSLAGERQNNAEVSLTQGVISEAPGTSTSLLRPDAPQRTDTTQSYDSVLNEAEDSLSGSLKLQTQTSHGQTSSQRSSPDLGISPESDIDPQSGMLDIQRSERDYQKNSRESLMSSPESKDIPSQSLKDITLDGGSILTSGTFRKNPIGEENQQLPFTRLSSLHDMNLRGVQGSASERWVPNKDALELILGMGISENAAKRGLYNTGNHSAELAIGWVFEHIANVELHEPFTPPVISSAQADMDISTIYHSYDDMIEGMLEADRGMAGGSFKMVFVANSSLKMGVGKLAAQVGHAALALYRFVDSQRDRTHDLGQWENFGAKKIVLKGTDTQHLLDLKQKAIELQISNILIHDAGRTQIDPGSLTILALFGRNKEVDCVTGKLKLL